MERRNFFKLIGTSAAVMAAGGMVACSSDDTLSSPASGASGKKFKVLGDPEVSFSTEVDVLIVGSGVAGLSAAMAPAEAGLSVMVVEKQELLGGESFNACGVMLVSGSKLQQAAGVKKTAIEVWDVYKQQLVDEGVSDLDFAKRLFVSAPDWVDHLATTYSAQFSDPATYVKNGTPDVIMLPKNGLGSMENIMTPLRDGLVSKGVTFLSGMRASAFIAAGDESIVGMRLMATKTHAVNDVRARRIVIATGGFTSNQTLIHAWLPAQEQVRCCTFASMGEGLVFCGEAGGQLADMEKAAWLTSDLPQVAAWGLFGPTIILDPTGKRFAREDDRNAAANKCEHDALGYWWTVFDKQLSEGTQARSVGQMTSKYAKRLVGPCDTLDDLAQALSVSADTLKATFEAYHKTVDEGKDAIFLRELFLKKLSAPYYALKQFPVRYKTRGGVKTDGDGRLLSATGSGIAGVFCCGSVGANSVDGLASNGAFGMLTGRAIAQALQEENEKTKTSS